MIARTYKFIAIFMFFSLFLWGKPGLCQKKYRYSIDVKEQKNRRVPLVFWLTETKSNFSEAKEWRKNKRIEERNSKKIRKHAYKIQKGYVQKRMKQSLKRAEWHNENKLPLLVKIKKRRNGKPI